MKNYLFVLIAGISSCDAPKNENNSGDPSIIHAQAFHFETTSEGRQLIVDEPWPNATESKKYLVEEPLKRVVCTSTTHLPFFEMLEREDAVVGFPNTSYIGSEIFRERVKQGLITDLGPTGGMNMELLLDLQPEAVVAFDMGGETAGLDKVKQMGIPVYYNADFLESTPLGRAEWIKFFGAILGEEQKADSVFSAITVEYGRLTKLAQMAINHPVVITGVVYGDTWFMPGGQNWASEFYSNAGGEYILASDSSSGWLELSFESVFNEGRLADYWIGTSSYNSKAEMIDAEPRYAEFKAFKNDRVYNYSKKRNSSGGYDFFESGYARPDLVLADLIKILHPDLLPSYKTTYFEQLK